MLEDVLHPAGVPVIFAKERLLSSDPDDWEEMVQEALDAEKGRLVCRELFARVPRCLACA